ncbi:MAG: hypothetical protein QM755_22770 [Luteolibacter sp.]
MNFRIIAHLFKADFLRLRWLFLLCWLLIPAAAWPSWSYDGLSQQTPLPRYLMVGGVYGPFGNPTDAFFICLQYALSILTLILAGALGYQSLAWNQARPVRKRELITAKIVSVVLLLVIPLVLPSVVNLMLRGMPYVEAPALSALAIGLRLGAAYLFGMIARGFWAWAGGMLLIPALSAFVLPRFGYFWFQVPISDPFGVSADHLSFVSLATAFGLLAIAALVPLRRIRPILRIPLVVCLWVGLSAYIVQQFGRLSELSMPAAFSFSTWEQRLRRWTEFPATRPEITDPVLKASFSEERTNPFIPVNPFRNGKSPGNPKQFLRITPTYTSPQERPGSFAVWERMGESTLTIQGQVAARGLPKPITHLAPGWSFQPQKPQVEAMAAFLPQNAQFMEGDDYDSRKTEQRNIPFSNSPPENPATEFLEPVLPALLFNGADAVYEADLAGTVFRYEKILEAPLWSTSTAEVDGRRIGIRAEMMSPVQRGAYAGPVIWLNDVVAVKEGRANWAMPGLGMSPDNNNWIAIIHLPGHNQLASCRISQTGSMLLSGCAAIQSCFLADKLHTTPRSELEDARIILLRPVIEGIVRTRIKSAPIPLKLDAEPRPYDGFRLERHVRNQGLLPPLEKRPDPKTATSEDYWRWTMASYGHYSSRWEVQDAIPFVDRQLPVMLTAQETFYEAIWSDILTSACPESRKNEVLTAFSQAITMDKSNWLANVVQDRGWAQDAIPSLRSMLSVEKDPWGQVMIATASTENPALLGDILRDAESGLNAETYEAVRNFPGIEPGLTNAIRIAYRKQKSMGNRFDGSVRQNTISTALRSGLPEAFQDAFSRYQPISKLRWSDISSFILPPPGTDLNSNASSAFVGHSASDYVWDPLSRRWALPSTLNPSSP